MADKKKINPELRIKKDLQTLSEDLKNLPKEDQQRVLQEILSSNKTLSVQMASVSQVFQGPLPPPNILGEYDKVSPGAAEKIISMAQGESAHVKTMDKRAQTFEFIHSMLGLLVAFLIVCAAIYFSYFFMEAKQYKYAAAVLSLLIAAPIIRLFVQIRAK